MPCHAMASHRIDSSRVISHIPQRPAAVVRPRLPSSSAAAHRCPTLMGDWPPPKRVALFSSSIRPGMSGMGEYSRAERGLCHACVIHFHTRLLGLKESNPWLPSALWCLPPGCQALPSKGACGLETKHCHNCGVYRRPAAQLGEAGCQGRDRGGRERAGRGAWDEDEGGNVCTSLDDTKRNEHGSARRGWPRHTSSGPAPAPALALRPRCA